MPSLGELQKTLLDLIYDKNAAGDLTWRLRDGEDSFQTSFAGYTIHLDKRKINNYDSYVVWVFDDNNVLTDRIEVAEAQGVPPGAHPHMTYRELFAEVYDNLQNGSKYKGLTDLIEKLRSS